MPHVIIEFTEGMASDVHIELLLDALHTRIAATGLFEAEHIRLRAYPIRFHRCGGSRSHFLHAQLRIHTGRSDAQKSALSSAVLATLREQALAAEVITVEVVELERASYRKFSNR